jgi:hypothetical protein
MAVARDPMADRLIMKHKRDQALMDAFWQEKTRESQKGRLWF